MAARDAALSVAGTAIPPGATPRTTVASRPTALPGSRFPLGVTAGEGGTNFAVVAGAAEGVLLCLFDRNGAEDQVPLLDYDAGVWYGFVPGVAVGQAYGYR